MREHFEHKMLWLNSAIFDYSDRLLGAEWPCPCFSKSAGSIVPYSETQSLSPPLSTGSGKTFIVFRYSVF
jgi:hypothetical protein